MKNQDEMLEALETDGIIKRNGDLWEAGPRYETLNRPFSEGLTEENDCEVKQSLLAMSVRFLKRGKHWTIQRLGSPDKGMVEHILISTQPVKSVQFVYHPPPEDNCDEGCHLFRHSQCETKRKDGKCDREHKPKDQYDDAGERVTKESEA